MQTQFSQASNAYPVIIGAGRGLKKVMQRVAAVSASDVPVLLLGESGTGKEVIARAIHETSPRAGRAFVRVNCGAISPELIDSELFGHERGAFTGAVAQKRGWFERANGGTLLLDETGDLPPAAQVRLLRVLQEGAFARVGGEHEVQVDVRIVAATHRDLPAMVQAAQFREDLWYRLSAYPIIIPPVRERLEDIPELAQHLLEKATHRFGVRTPTLSPGDFEILRAYPWPGNVREMASVIDRAVLLYDGAKLDLHSALERTVFIPPAGPEAEPHQPVELTLSLDAAISRHICRVLQITAGKIEGPDGAAAVLQVNPHTLRARMRKLGIDWAAYRSAFQYHS